MQKTHPARLCIISLLLIMFSTSAMAVALTPNSGWQKFYWDDTGPTYDPSNGYQLTVTNTATVRLTDGYVYGDEFSITINGLITLFTSPVDATDDGNASGTYDGDAAWADTRFSRISFQLNPGTYQLDIAVTKAASGTMGGAAFIDVTAVPEPSALLMLGLGLGSLMLVRRRKVKR